MQNKFIEDLELVKGRSPLTIRNYTHWLENIRRHTGKKLEKITVKSAKSFISEMRKAGMSPKTINLHIIVLRGFLKYCRQNGVETVIPEAIETISFQEKKIEIIDKADIEKLFSVDLPVREKALIEILFSTGLRIAELKSLQIEDVRFDEQSITVRGKGGKIRLVFLSEKAVSNLSQHVGERKSGPVFLESVRTLQRLVEDSAEKAGITARVTPHMIRHVFATDLLQNGANIYDAQKLLGHSSVSTTERYLHVSNEHLKEQFKKFHRTVRL